MTVYSFLSDAKSIASIKADKYDRRFAIEVVRRPAGDYGYEIKEAGIADNPILYVEPGNVVVEVAARQDWLRNFELSSKKVLTED
jgi:hypothetical protein